MLYTVQMQNTANKACQVCWNIADVHGWGTCLLGNAFYVTDLIYATHGVYKEGLPKLTPVLVHLDRLLGKFMPKLKKHFDNNHGFEAILYSLQRISMCLCLYSCNCIYNTQVTCTEFLKLNDTDSILHYIQLKLYTDFICNDYYTIQDLERNWRSRKNKNRLSRSP